MVAKVCSSPSAVMLKGSPAGGAGSRGAAGRAGIAPTGRTGSGAPARTGEAGVVHQHVQPRLLPQDGLGKGTHGGQRAGVQQAQQHRGVARGRADLLHRRLAPLPAPARQDGAGIPAGQLQGHALADPCRTQSGHRAGPHLSPVARGAPRVHAHCPRGPCQAARALPGARCRTTGTTAPKQEASLQGQNGASSPGAQAVQCRGAERDGDGAGRGGKEPGVADRCSSVRARLEHAAQTWSPSPRVALWQPRAVREQPRGEAVPGAAGSVVARWDRRHRGGLGCQSLTQRGQSPGAGAAQSLARESSSRAEDAGGQQVHKHVAGGERGAGHGGTGGTTCTPWGPAASLSWGHLCLQSKAGSWRGGSCGSQAPWPCGVPQPRGPVLHLPGPPRGILTSCVPAPQALQHPTPPAPSHRCWLR